LIKPQIHKPFLCFSIFVPLIHREADGHLNMRSVLVQAAWKELVADLRNIAELNNSLGADKDELLLANEALQRTVDELTRERQTLAHAARKDADSGGNPEAHINSVEMDSGTRIMDGCGPLSA
jgi:hypothetical protein